MLLLYVQLKIEPEKQKAKQGVWLWFISNASNGLLINNAEDYIALILGDYNNWLWSGCV